jgi:hypothetical protein
MLDIEPARATAISFYDGDGERREHRHRVGLGPQPNLARGWECTVLHLVDQLAIELDGKAVAANLDSQRIPRALRYRSRSAIGSTLTLDWKVAATAVLDLVEYDVVFESIRSDDVIIIGVAIEPD